MCSSRRNLLRVWVWSLVLVNVVALCIAQDYTFVVEEIGHRLLCNDVNTLIVNRSIPGPALNLTYGQTVTVNCHIQPGNNYTYSIILTEEEGTLWWHAHSEWSRATVYGAIYIRPSEGREYPYPVQPDGQQGIVLGTWFETDVQDFIDDFLEKGASFPVDYQALTINGLPGDFYDDIECTSGTSDVGMFEMEVEYGKTYLLRVINAALNEDLTFAVAGHSLTVVGTDAAYIEPVVTDQISIGTGQTMDVLLVANQTPGYYYMEARHSESGKNLSTSGLIKYTNLTEITTVSTSLTNFVSASTFQHKFRSLNNSNYTYDVPQTVDTNIFMTVSLNTLQDCAPHMGCNITGYASLTNITFVNPNIDILQAYYLNMSDVYTTDFPYKASVFDYTNATGVSTYSEVNGTKVFVVDYNSTVELIFQGTNIKYDYGMDHTMHLHGHSFYFVGWGSGNYNESDAEDYNLVDPPLINTVAMGGDAWVAIRFRADNPGVWFMHCHRARHLMGGMAAVMIVRNGPTEETSMLPPPHSLKGSCAADPRVSTTTVAPWSWGHFFSSSMFN
ncbi:hypothetical protein V2J09_011742 [Rumex salicifolius]